MNSKKIAAFVISAALLLGGTSIPSASAAAVKQVNIQPVSVQLTFDGSELQPPAGQFVFNYQGTTYVPLRFVSYALQKNVEWDGKKSQVTISDPTESQRVAIKERLLNAGKSSSTANPSATPVSITPINANFVFNGESKTTPKGQISFIHQGTIYVPIRFVAESTGSVITWDPIAKAITGTSQAYLKEQKENTGKETSNPDPTKTEQTPGTPAGQSGNPGGAGGAGGAGGGTTSSYDSITSNTAAKLNALQDKSELIMWDLADQYLRANNEDTKQQLLTQGRQKLNSLTAEFEVIVTSAEQQLRAGGYSTDIINEYREEFESQIEAGKELAERMAD